MSKRLGSLAAVIAATMVAGTCNLSAEEHSEDGYEIEKSGGQSYGGFTVGGAQTKLVTTASIVASLNEATQFCSAITQTAYAIDCIADRLDQVNRSLAGVAGYEEVRVALNNASRGLNQIARENSSPTLPRAQFEQRKADGEVSRTSRPLVPVAEARMDVAVAQAVAVIEETETVLLRSAESSTERAVQYQRIAQAIGSNKVLLRSL